MFYNNFGIVLLWEVNQVIDYKLWVQFQLYIILAGRLPSSINIFYLILFTLKGNLR